MAMKLNAGMILKIKEGNSQVTSKSMKKLIQFIIVLIISHNLNAQNANEISVDRNQTTLLLEQLKTKVSEIKSIQVKLESFNLNSNEGEQLKNQLSKMQRDMIVFLYHEVQERCTIEKRLLEISTIVEPIDLRLAEKFIVLNTEQTSK
jgi:hypothetical protein